MDEISLKIFYIDLKLPDNHHWLCKSKWKVNNGFTYEKLYFCKISELDLFDLIHPDKHLLGIGDFKPSQYNLLCYVYTDVFMLYASILSNV